ncbi:GGDEF domain-containing protein [Thiohalophilus thiocyanatoxydans]|uniref:diguanylate cyclase n=1 Tax=Thiohalophilus thiocyanatoxydans TaxID=381308 RepID=A0A4R8IGD5_9GAMM|nr:GGDEF domain-containing protein [Thiohalophilus thiocyanatoxydans]TDX99630.1 diguanylate cyclase (GGDEF)-like protein [Thiohalophilus thiocyanatoxydans]
MRKKLESKQIIIVNAVVVLLFIVILVTVNLFHFNHLNSNLSSINEIYNTKLEIITRMSRIVRDRSLTMLNMHLSNDIWHIDEQYMRFNQLAPEFIQLRERLRQQPMAPDEQAELDRCLALIRKTQPLQERIVQRIYDGRDAQVLDDIMYEDMPLESRLWEGFNRLDRIVRNNAEQARQVANEEFKNSLYIIISVAAVLALLTVLLMKHALRRLQLIETRLIDRAELLSWDATHDPLTNIWNRRFLEHRVNQLINGDYPPEPRHVLVYIDLDNFKPINDIYGHFLGDDFLRAIALCVEACIRKNDTLARIGGDEFAILLENCTGEKASAIAECVRSAISNCTITYDGQPIRNGGCSIGIAVFDEHLENFQNLLKQADHACYDAKRAGGNRISYADRN